jgi:hypothetical protein
LRFLDCVHRIHAIDDQIEQNLLELHSITHDGRQILGQFGADRDAARKRFMTSKGQDILDDIPQTQKRPLDGRPFRQLADTQDNGTRAVGIVDDLP